MSRAEERVTAPSLSTRVRMGLYLGEGLALGAGLTYLFLQIISLVLILSEGPLSVGAMVIGLVFLFLIGRNLGIYQRARRASRRRTRSSTEQEWRETRQWSWVILIAISVGGLLFTTSVSIWGWDDVIRSNTSVLVFGPVTLLGLSLWGYLLTHHYCRDNSFENW